MLKSIEPKVLIVYLATNNYVKLYRKFVDTLSKFLPNTDKDIAIYTNKSIEEFDNITGENRNPECFNEYFEHILHMPWPIVALEKYNIILDALEKLKDNNYSHVYMFDASVEFVQEVPERIYKTDKLIGALFYGWDAINHDCSQINGTEPNSYGYVNCDQYPYVCSGTIGGPIDKVKKLCETCMSWMEIDLKNHIIPKHDDESYFVRYFTELPDNEKTIVPANFDWAVDDDWFPGYRIDNVYIQSQDDNDLMADKFLETKKIPELPINLPKIPSKEIKTFDQYMKDLDL